MFQKSGPVQHPTRSPLTQNVQTNCLSTLLYTPTFHLPPLSSFFRECDFCSYVSSVKQILQITLALMQLLQLPLITFYHETFRKPPEAVTINKSFLLLCQMLTIVLLCGKNRQCCADSMLYQTKKTWRYQKITCFFPNPVIVMENQ